MSLDDLTDFHWVVAVLLISMFCSFVAAIIGDISGIKKIALYMANGTIMAGIVFASLTAIDLPVLARIGASVAVAYIGIDSAIAKLRDLINIFKGEKNARFN